MGLLYGRIFFALVYPMAGRISPDEDRQLPDFSRSPPLQRPPMFRLHGQYQKAHAWAHLYFVIMLICIAAIAADYLWIARQWPIRVQCGLFVLGRPCFPC